MTEVKKPAAYITLPQGKKMAVITGSAFLWFYNLIFAFSMPVVLPSIMTKYDMMAYYAILSGVNSLTSCAATLIGGKLGDRFGRRRVCLFAGYIRLFFMLACALPTNGTLFFTFYVAGNLFGGFLNAYPAAILSDVTVPAERPRWFGIFGTINGAALLLGLLGGGVIVDLLGPLTIFWFVAPFGVVSMILLTLFYPNRPAAQISKLDFTGMTFLIIAVTCILTWCSFGDDLFARVSLFGILLLLTGILMVVLLIFYERRTSDPLIDMELFKDSHFTMSFCTHLLIAPMMCLCSTVLTLFGQVGLGLSATISGTLALPKNILFLILPTFLGAWIAKNQNRFRTAFITCGAAIAVASLLASTWGTDTSILTIYLVMLIFGIGTSCQSVCIQPYMQITVPLSRTGSATAMIQFANSIGVVIFNAFYNIFYNAQYASAMELGGGTYLAEAISTTFSYMAIISAVCGAGIAVLALKLIPSGKRAAIQMRETLS